METERLVFTGEVWESHCSGGGHSLKTSNMFYKVLKTFINENFCDQ